MSILNEVLEESWKLALAAGMVAGASVARSRKKKVPTYRSMSREERRRRSSLKKSIEQNKIRMRKLQRRTRKKH
jgi:hypothetical protein